MNSLSQEKIDEIKRRSEAARPGPWKSYIEGRDHESGSSFIKVGEKAARVADIELIGVTEADQDFIAHAREDIPLLLTELERLRNSK